MRFSRILLLAGIALIAGVILSVAIWHGEPREHRLTDGSTLRLEEVFYGKRRLVNPGGLMEKVKTAVRQAWNDWIAKTPPSGASSSSWWMNTTIHSNENALFVYLSRRDSRGDYQGVDVETAEILDEHGCVFVPTQAGGEDHGLLSGKPSTTGWMGGGYSVGWFRFEAFPRHERKFLLRTYSKGKLLAEFVLVNPAPPATDANWATESLPITKKFGEVSFKLANLEVKKNSRPGGHWGQVPLRIAPTYEIIEAGKPSTNWQALDTELYDCSGNFASEVVPDARYLCPKESAWKLRVKFFSSEQSSSASNSVWKLSGVQIPEAGKAVALGSSQTVQGVLLSAFTIAGPGDFTYSNDVPIRAEISKDGPKKNSLSTSQSGSSGTIYRVKGGTPHLMMDFTGLSEDQRVTVRATDERGRDYYGHEWRQWDDHPPPKEKPSEIYYLQTRYGNDRIFLAFQFPPDVKKVDLTFCVHACYAPEFVFKPASLRIPTTDGKAAK